MTALAAVLAASCGPGGDIVGWDDGDDETAVAGRVPLPDLTAILAVAGLAPVSVLGAWVTLGERSSGVCKGGLRGDDEARRELRTLPAGGAGW